MAKPAKPKPAKAALKQAILTVVRGANPRVWTVEDLMVATQCTDQELLSRCCYELVDDGRLRPKLLPLRLSAEEMQARRVAGLSERQKRREFDRMMGEATWGPPRPKIGRHDTYNRDAIRTTARTVIREEGLPATQTKLREKVEERLAGTGIAVPSDTQFKEFTADIFKAAKATAPKSR